MTDKYLKFAHSKIGKPIVSLLGLPKPPKLARENATNPHYLTGDLLNGFSTNALYKSQIKQSLEETDLNFVGIDSQFSHLVFDASGLQSTEQAIE